MGGYPRWCIYREYHGGYASLGGVYAGCTMVEYASLCICWVYTTLGICSPTTPWVYPLLHLECRMSAVPLTGYTRGVQQSPGLKREKEPGWEALRPLGTLKV